MKTTLIGATLAAVVIGITMFISSSAMAKEKKDPFEYCGVVSDLAEQVMTMRQMKGATMKKSMAMAKDNELHTKMVIAAYEENRYSSPEMIKGQVTAFANYWYSDCYKALTRKAKN